MHREVSLIALGLLLSASLYAQDDPLHCAGPSADAEPDTAAWYQREAQSLYCAEQRHYDAAQHPVLAMPVGPPVSDYGRFTDDAYRVPSRHDNKRFRFTTATVTTPEGQALAVEVYRPCDATSCPDLPATLERFEPPYPAVISVHGGASRKELHWWSSQPLAESGYMVISFDDATTGTSPQPEQVHAILDWLFSSESEPTANGEFNPFRAELDADHVGMAGHSAGGVLVSRIGQEDPRISAIVSWDRAQSGPMPDDLQFHAPAMFQFADYNCQRVPVCQPEYRQAAPDPAGPGDKGDDFQRLRAADIDTMQIAIRAATHLDWTPPVLAGSRYGESVSLYYTLAWFDRYLRGADDLDVAREAFQRLTASNFDDSTDIHNLSQGIYDPVAALQAADPYAGNQPYQLAGMPVANRLSFYYDSKCFIGMPQPGAGPVRRAESEDIRSEGCKLSGPPHPGNAGPDQGQKP